MNPLDALSAIAPGAGSMQMPLSAATPSMPGAPVGEGTFQVQGDQVGPMSLMGGSSMGGASPMSALSSPASSAPGAAAGGGPSTWGHMVQQMVMDVNSQQATATQQVNDVLQGGPTPVHQAMISTEEANLSFEFLSEMRNKLVDAYQQIMQMQV